MRKKFDLRRSVEMIEDAIFIVIQELNLTPEQIQEVMGDLLNQMTDAEELDQ